MSTLSLSYIITLSLSLSLSLSLVLRNFGRFAVYQRRVGNFVKTFGDRSLPSWVGLSFDGRRTARPQHVAEGSTRENHREHASLHLSVQHDGAATTVRPAEAGFKLSWHVGLTIETVFP